MVGAPREAVALHPLFTACPFSLSFSARVCAQAQVCLGASLEAWGEAPGDPRPAAWEGRKGDGYRYPVQGSLFIDEPEVPF